MKQIYNVLVYEAYTARMESLFNRFRIGLNDWDRSKTFNLNGEQVVNYTIACTENVYTSLLNVYYNG